MAEDNDIGSSWSSQTFIKFDKDAQKAALFAFSPDSRLRLESEGKLSTVGDLYGIVMALSFVPSTKDSAFRPMGFHANSMHKSGNVTGYEVSTSPLALSPSDYPMSYVDANKDHVITACRYGICLGTLLWKDLNFNGSNAVSNDGYYQLITLQAIPVF